MLLDYWNIRKPQLKKLRFFCSWLYIHLFIDYWNFRHYFYNIFLFADYNSLLLRHNVYSCWRLCGVEWLQVQGRRQPQGDKLWTQSGSDRTQIWDNSGTFHIKFQHILTRTKMYWNMIWKSNVFVPFGANLTHFVPTSDIRVWPRQKRSIQSIHMFTSRRPNIYPRISHSFYLSIYRCVYLSGIGDIYWLMYILGIWFIILRGRGGWGEGGNLESF